MYIGEIVHKGVRKRKFKYKPNTYSGWNYVMRAPKDKRELIAQGMELAIKNKSKIKYDNGSKSGRLYDDTKPKFDFRLTKKTYTNCSALASVCCRYAGIKTPKKSSSLTLHKKWTGFKRIKYKQGMKLYRGDVLVRCKYPSPHTAVVL